ncbi:MAG: hypothetical protein LBT31_05130 [Synergistaceae bacterium]|jgi:hypothetical protein|nr:hypothetical protein [Synergistaceae bacterium]
MSPETIGIVAGMAGGAFGAVLSVVNFGLRMADNRGKLVLRPVVYISNVDPSMGIGYYGFGLLYDENAEEFRQNLGANYKKRYILQDYHYEFGFEVTNLGKHPIYLTELGFSPEKKALSPERNLARELFDVSNVRESIPLCLQSGEMKIIRTSKYSVIKAINKGNKIIYIRPTMGKPIYCNALEMLTLLAEVYIIPEPGHDDI